MKLPLSLLLAACTLRAADFPAPYNSEPDKSGPMPAAEAAAKMKLPPGFTATVFAAEPDVQNPIGLSWDARGRLWIAENYTYAEAGVRFDLKLRDRILIFEDTDGDGRHDKRTVFTDEVQMLTSIEVGLGGVWALALPHLVFIPDANHDGVPDGPAEVVLDGFAAPQENYHNVANGLRFGPDGWIYGRCGASGAADVGAPGTPPEQRIPVRGGMWRYHPQRKTFEAITSGNTNPWGHDWNEHGELFYVNTVNGHLWHAVAGMHFVRPHTVDPNPRTYGLIDQHADHWHFDVGKGWQNSRAGAASDLGGGHSHIGAMIYLADNWPAEYRGRLLTLNQHGKRANQELLERQGSGYVAKHGADMLLAADPWFVGLDISYGPDGGVYVLDWSDTGECHERNGVHRTSGRIYKITHGESKRPSGGDLTKLTPVELIDLHFSPNEWYVRQARLELIRRKRSGASLAGVADKLREVFAPEMKRPTVFRLRALWSLSAMGEVDGVLLRQILQHSDEHVRTWAVRLLSDAWPLDTLMSVRPTWRPEFAAAEQAGPAWREELVRLARDDSSGLVRLALASVLQRLPIAERIPLAAALVARGEDDADHNLPLLIWYGLIPAGDTNPGGLVKVAANCHLPQTRKYIARRLAEDAEKNPQLLNELLRLPLVSANATFAADIFAGIAEGLAGWRKAPKPAMWDEIVAIYAKYPNASLLASIRELSVVFGDGRALDEVKRVALDNKADMAQRKAALQTLIDNRAPDLREVCEKLLGVRFLNPVAARGLTMFDDPAIGIKLVGAYKQFHQSERPQLLATLVSRATFARPLLDAVATGKIARGDLTPFHARQILSLKDATLDKQLAEAWGELRESAADKRTLMAHLKEQLTPAVLAQADKSAGRALYTAACAICHRLYGEGGEVGPDLTGTGRANLDYLLENIVDPSAAVSADFRMTVMNLKDGRVLNGFITTKTDRTVTLRTMTESLTLERSEITAQQEMPQSLMPEGLLSALTETQVRDLFAYLMHPNQVPLSAPPR
jgi:putative membrane-bound dehydrogenase-like protein